MVSSYFYRAMALMLTVGALSKIQKIERREQARSEKFAKLLKYEDKKEKATSQQVVCYYRIEKNDTRKLQPEDIDASLCTHLIVGYAEVKYDFVLPRAIQDLERFNRTVALKKKNAKNEDTLIYWRKIQRFIFSLLHFLDKYKFDGVDFDWEFPSWNGANPLERFYFILLLKELRFVIEQAKKKFLISCAVAAHVAIIDTSYDVPEMAKAVDFVNLMSYDFQMYSQEHPVTSHHSPLFSRNSEKKLNYFLNAVCQFLKAGAVQIFDVSTKVPYAYLDHNWIAYDNEHSISFKSHWVKDEGYGGIMIFNLNNDD
ncbi:acidic mammalian chitinase [Caerostris extrusa]|uniref:Acidic mammalian chitinase n=1 Tax=Caerostris extrusa TaxID=172846 RepID=A0AAV4YCA5_CAEEX|nr:acidic mammalian chitinase [Caerostris extrusa]